MDTIKATSVLTGEPTLYDAIGLEVKLWQASNDKTLRQLGGYIATSAQACYEAANARHTFGIRFAEMYEHLYVDMTLDADVQQALYENLHHFDPAQVAAILAEATRLLQDKGMLQAGEKLQFSRRFMANFRIT